MKKLSEQETSGRDAEDADPQAESSNIAFEDLFNLTDIQRLQDLFAQAFGVASLITRPDGAPITKPSNFTHFCSVMIRSNPKGAANCEHSDAMVGRHNPHGPNIQPCLSAGLCNAGASITVGGRHIANWLIGQVRNETIDSKRIFEYARNIGADEEAFYQAFLSVPVMSPEKFSLAAQTLFVVANQLSASSYLNIQQSQSINRLRETEAAFLKNEERFKRLLQNSSDVIGVVNKAGILTSINGPMEETFGYSTEELIGTSGFDKIHPDDLERVGKDFSEYLLNPSAAPKRAEYRYRHKNGTWITVETVGSNLLDDPLVRGLVLNMRDVSERNRLHDQLQQAMKMEAIGRLAGGVAHDFNNLLTSIICNVDLALQETSHSNPLLQPLSEISKAAQSAAVLTRQLLAFSRKQVIEPQILNLNDLANKIRTMLERLLGEDIEIMIRLGENLGSVRVDAGQFEQVLVNLSVNARDAMPDGGTLTIETANLDPDCCVSHQLQPGRYVMLAVSDTGHGMSDEVKKHLFEPFFTTKTEGRGTGLGLATTFGIVKQAGGAIEVDSEIGQGTIFKIFLPRMIDAPAQAPVRESPGPEELNGTETVLVVEDEENLRAMASKILKRFGYTVLQASNGEEAFLAVEKFNGNIDLLMTDVVMPGINGRELAERFACSYPQIKILFTSGYTEDIIGHHGVIEDNLNFIGKPYSPRGLARKVREVLGPAPKHGGCIHGAR